MNAVATGDSVNIYPITREEMFLCKAAGMDVNTPDPITRREMFLSKISGGTGGGSNGGNSGEIVLVPLNTFIVDDEYEPYTSIEIPDDIGFAYSSVVYAVYFDGTLYDRAKLHGNGRYGNPLFWAGADDGTPFLFSAGEGVYAYPGEHTIRIIKIL